MHFIGGDSPCPDEKRTPVAMRPIATNVIVKLNPRGTPFYVRAVGLSGDAEKKSSGLMPWGSTFLGHQSYNRRRRQTDEGGGDGR